VSNEIVLENQKPGNPASEWGLSGVDASGSFTPSIEGYAAEQSVDQGETVHFKINTDSTDYRIDIYRLGYYNGDGARKVATIEHHSGEPQFQPEALVDSTTGLVDAGNWHVSDSWDVPSDAVSGVYLAKLTRTDGTFSENHIAFVVRDDDGASDILVQTDDTTWQAYNDWGGHSLYDGLGTAAVSYNRPIASFAAPTATTPGNALSDLFSYDYPTIRWLEQNGYDVSYSTGVDTAKNGDELLEHKTFLTAGHDEYWSAEQRSNVEAARDAGVNLVFWSGNDVYWKTRWDSSIDGSGTEYRTMISYKTSQKPNVSDPSGTWTGLWRDPAGHYDGAEAENALTGTMYMVNYDPNNTYYPVTLDSGVSGLRLWRNTDVANLTAGQTLTLGNYLGYEWNVDADNGYRPNGLIHLSSTRTAVSNVAVPSDPNYYQVNFQYTLPEPGFATHNLTLYKAPSGALVFSAGTVSWAWALDEHHSSVQMADSHAIQQGMVNLFADMGIQPETLTAGLVSAEKSNDFSGPIANITSYSLDSTAIDQSARLTGTAGDHGGGVIAGVQVSTDGGVTWHLATGINTWSYTWNTNGVTSDNILIAAIDDSANIGNPAAIGYDKFAVTASYDGFGGDLGWNNISFSRSLVDLDGNGKLDYVGFGDSGMWANFSGIANGTPTFSSSGAAYLDHFGAVEGWTPSYLRSVSYVGDLASMSATSMPHAPIVWGQGDSYLYFFNPIQQADGSIGYQADSVALAGYSLELGWSKSYNFEFIFLQKGNATTEIPTDTYASIIGFGDLGIYVDPQAFAPGASGTDTYLIAGSEAFGNLAGFDSQHDIRTLHDYFGNEIDLNHDGVTDVVGIGPNGIVYALGQEAGGGATAAGTYTLGALQTGSTAGVGFSQPEGWDATATPRFIADVNGDNQLDIVGFGNGGVWVALGQTPATDGSGAFAEAYLASPGYGSAQGWTVDDHVRQLGDFNGDGALDILGFGQDLTSISLGGINQNGQFEWGSAISIPGYANAQGWNTAEHFRGLGDINGDGVSEIIVSGTIGTDILHLV
jgi:hypothetical protein